MSRAPAAAARGFDATAGSITAVRLRPLLALVFLLSAWAASAAPAPRLRLGVGWLDFDRFLVRDGREIDQNALRLETRLTWDLPDPGDRTRFYLDLQRTDYESFDPADQIQAGWELRRLPDTVEAYLRYGEGRPQFYSGDDLVTVREVRLFTRYGRRFHDDDWQVRVLAGWYEERFDAFAAKDNETWQTGASLRYRGWGYTFSPELGVLYREQDARSDNYDYDQRDLLLELRSAPTSSLYMTLRYRYRVRDYSAAARDDSNFERSDDRHQIRFQAFYDLSERWGLDLYAARENVDSLKPGSSRTTRILGLGLRFEIGGR